MDAFTISIANGISNAHLKKSQVVKVTFVYAFFQFLMPLLGWFFVHRAAVAFKTFNKFIPLIALVLLLFLGIRMVLEGRKQRKACEIKGEADTGVLTGYILLLQGIATSIDALSTGFAIHDYSGEMAFVCSLIIAIVTWILCFTGMQIGKKVGCLFSANATTLGGVVLIVIGIEVFAKGVLL